MSNDLDFLQRSGASRLDSYDPPPSLFDPPTNPDPEPSGVDLDYEIPKDQWKAQSIGWTSKWRAEEWAERPLRFIDGKDVGQTIAWLQAPGGYPVPVRLSEIGSVDVRVEDGVCHREYAVVERVVSMVVNAFPWDEIEAFAAALQRHDFRLLPAKPPGGELSYDFEEMRNAAQNRSNDEMTVLEEAVLSQAHLIPTVVDGRLEPRSGGFNQHCSPVVGVIKTQRDNYLHPVGLQLLYQLQTGERTPLFLLRDKSPQIVSWFLRLTGANGSMPNWGIVRIEVPRKRFEALAKSEQISYVTQLSRLLSTYRCRDKDYSRAAVSLHPIVRGERLLSALFTPSNRLIQHFYRLTNL